MMRTRILTICMIAMGIAFMPQTADAQGLLKKIGKGIEKVNKTLEGATDKANVATGQAVKQENGVIVTNPLSKAFDVELLGAYGTSTSENFGSVELVLKVTMKDPERNKINFGGTRAHGATIAFDADGNNYKMQYYNVGHEYDVTEGIPVKVVLSGSDAFQNVRKVDVLPLIKICAWVKYEVEGELQFKNVPVQWDVEH